MNKKSRGFKIHEIQTGPESYFISINIAIYLHKFVQKLISQILTKKSIKYINKSVLNNP